MLKSKQELVYIRQAATLANDALDAALAAARPGAGEADVYAVHARTLDDAGFGAARLNACGYAIGARFAPSWMEREMFYDGAPTVMQPRMVFFLDMILMDSETGTAMDGTLMGFIAEAIDFRPAIQLAGLSAAAA